MDGVLVRCNDWEPGRNLRPSSIMVVGCVSSYVHHWRDYVCGEFGEEAEVIRVDGVKVPFAQYDIGGSWC